MCPHKLSELEPDSIGFKAIGMKLRDYCFIAENKWSVNLTGLPSGTIFIMHFSDIT